MIAVLLLAVNIALVGALSIRLARSVRELREAERA